MTKTKASNYEIREEIEKRRLKYWEVAAQIGVNATTFSIWMRTELTPERKAKVVKALKELR